MVNKVKFIERNETQGIAVVFTQKETTAKKVIKAQLSRGLLNAGLHYLLHMDGSYEQLMPEELYADYDLEYSETHIYVLCVSPEKMINDAQKRALKVIGGAKIEIIAPSERTYKL
jgi:phage anti-repressor protein